MGGKTNALWLSLILSGYLLVVSAGIFIANFSAIQASNPAFEITLIVVAILALLAIGRTIFLLRRAKNHAEHVEK